MTETDSLSLEINIKKSGTSANKINELAESLQNLKKAFIEIKPFLNSTVNFTAKNGISDKKNTKTDMANLPDAKKTLDVDSNTNLEKDIAKALEPLDKFKGLLTSVSSASKEIRTRFSSLSDVVKGAFSSSIVKKFTSAIKGTKKPLSTLFGDIMRIAKYRAIRSFIKMITEGLTFGLSNAYQWSKNFGGEFATSMDKIATATNYVRNSIGATLIPILESVAPIIDEISDAAVTMINKINQAISLLSGNTTWTKAIKKTNEYQKATDKLKKSLLGFDEINKLDGADNTNNYDFVEEVIAPVDGTTFTVFGTLTQNLEKVKKLIDDIKNSMKKVSFNSTTFETAKTLLKHIFELIGSIAECIDRAWNKNEVGTRILERIDGIVESILKFWDRIVVVTKTWFDSLDLSPLFESIEFFLGKFEDSLGTILGDISELYENYLLPIFKWLIESVFPTIINMFAKTVDETTMDFDMIFQVITGFMGSINKLIHGDWAGAWEDFKSIFDSVAKWMVFRLLSLVERIGTFLDTFGLDFFNWADIDPHMYDSAFDVKPDTTKDGNATNRNAILSENTKGAYDGSVQISSDSMSEIKDAIVRGQEVPIQNNITLDGEPIYKSVVGYNRANVVRTGTNPLLGT